MKKPSCFHATKTAINGIASVELTNQDGFGARDPRIWLTMPSLANRNSHTDTTATLALT